MNRLPVEIFCPSCHFSHMAHIEAHQLQDGTDTIETECPHCNEGLTVAYELRVAAKYVRPMEHQYPKAWRLGQGW